MTDIKKSDAVKESAVKEEKGGNIGIIAAIIIAAVIIGGAVMLSNRNAANEAKNPTVNQAGEQDLSGIRGPQEDDHRLGNVDAKVAIIEYSDTECPFCKDEHAVLNRIADEYDDADVVWIYRHLPLAQLHSKAAAEAHATECAAELGGNDGFWTYTNRLYEITPSNNGLDLAELPNIAEFAGLDRAAFEECMESERHLPAIEEDFREIVGASGGSVGTPTSVVIAPDGSRTIVSGVNPNAEYEKWKSIIDGFLQTSSE